MEAQNYLEKAKEMLKRFKGLPSLPTVLSEALRLTADPSVSYDKVVDIVSRDPNLSGRLLRIANSPYYGLKNRVTNLRLALVLLGIREFRCILIGSSLLDLMKFKNFQYQEHYKKLWRESLFMASFSRQFSKILNLNYEGEDFLVGLLANIGASILLSQTSQKYFEIIQKSNSNHKNQLELELTYFGFTHTDIASAFLKDWDIPPLLWDSIWRQYDFDYLPLEKATDPKLSALLRIARYTLIDIQENILYENTMQKSFNILGNSFENYKSLWEELKHSQQSILTDSKIDFETLN